MPNIDIPTTLEDLEDAMDELESAEDFLRFFGIEFDASVVQVNRLHILQRFHDYLGEAPALSDDPTERFSTYAGWLDRAYQDFVHSDALTEKVFQVFRMHEPRTVNVGFDELLAGKPKTADHHAS
jgi:nitrogenase-stabilizing/protective protein